jgi:hypothetical protein
MAAMAVVARRSGKMSSLRGIRAVARPTDRRDDVKTRATIAEGTDKPELHDAERLAGLEGESRGKLEKLLDFVRSGGQRSELHQVEREILVQLLGLGRTSWEATPLSGERALLRDHASDAPSVADLDVASARSRTGA